MKKILSILIVALICLSFVACDESNDNTPTGTNTNNSGNSTIGGSQTQEPQKLDRGTTITTDNPFFALMKQKLEEINWKYPLKEDGTSLDQCYWWITDDTDNSLTVIISDEYKYKFLISIWRAGDTPYVTLYHTVPMYMYDTEFVDWFPPAVKDSYQIPYIGGTHDLVKNLCKTWVKAGQTTSEPFEELTFHQDGTCVVDGSPCVWTISTQGYGVTNATHLYINIWDTTGTPSKIGCVTISASWDVLTYMQENGVLVPGGFAPKSN